MPFLLIALASVTLAWIRGASPLGLGRMRLRWLALPLVSFSAQWLSFVQFSDSLAAAAWAVQLASGACLLAFAWGNRHLRGMLVVAVGVVLNLVAVLSNGGFMPVRISDAQRIGNPLFARHLEIDGHYQKSSVLAERTRLPWLADVIFLPLPIGPGRMLSPGDILVGAGTFVFLQSALIATRPRPKRPSRTSRATPDSRLATGQNMGRA